MSDLPLREDYSPRLNRFSQLRRSHKPDVLDLESIDLFYPPELVPPLSGAPAPTTLTSDSRLCPSQGLPTQPSTSSPGLQSPMSNDRCRTPMRNNCCGNSLGTPEFPSEDDLDEPSTTDTQCEGLKRDVQGLDELIDDFGLIPGGLAILVAVYGVVFVWLKLMPYVFRIVWV
ncbi:hypothetical protein QQZ08_011283 [Neonectria magnoliae]|uniref:Uncharacterized protein n=1 Tax=Neonectria magnoliae TaxID=2732573 RepID=A0ABR1HBL3_9HYPO